MRFQVPQFVDIEDRIIGPLTLKQFAYYLLAILVLAPLYVLVDLGLLITLALPILGIAALFAHGKFYGQPFLRILISFAAYMTSERQFLWRREANARPLKIVGPEYTSDTDPETVASLSDISQELATAGTVVSDDAEDPLLDAGEGSLATVSAAPDGSDGEESGEEITSN